MKDLRKIKKVKSLKHVRLERVHNEISDLVSAVQSGDFDSIKGFRPHQVTLDGEHYVACDAKYLNRHTHQSGRGDFRYLIAQGEYAGLAVHANTNGYRRAA